jgi:hypothetical protein
MSGKTVELRTHVEKIASDEMELMFHFLKKTFKGRIPRKPRSAEELQKDVFELLTGKKS